MNEEIFKFKGTISRSIWWVTAIPLAVVSEMLDRVVDQPEASISLILIVLAMFIGIVYAQVAINKARLNEAGWSGWWMLCPVVNLVVMGFFGPKTNG